MDVFLLWNRYAQFGTNQLREANNDAYRKFCYIITKHVSVCRHQISFFYKTIDALIKKNLNPFSQLGAFSTNSFIR